ncbi:MAG TPA: M1 family metallopeptidase [Sphingobacteriaceae bacterium]|nr:M1 family metallopeptidase [Sphingobacteriaceae bacterium]
MKFPLFLRCSAFAVTFLLSCSTLQKVNLDPVVVKENARGSHVFQASYPKITDLIHTKLDVRFNWDSAYVIGKASITAKPYFYSSDNIVLNANGFRINKVGLLKNEDITPLKYTYNGKLINIQLDKTYTKDQSYTLYIDYVAMPNKLKVGEDIASASDRGLYFINRNSKDKDKPRQIWTQGETENNSNWFPTINGPQEKMSQEVQITVPNEYVTLSNGELEFSSLNGNGTRTDSWRQEKPHSTYLTMLAVGNFTVTKDKWRDKEVNYYTEPQFAKNARLVFGKTPEMIEFFSKSMGIDYPWEKYSQIVVREFVSGAMENTSATVLFDRMNMSEGQYLDENYEDIIAHELYHHWFGDLVTAESWANLPLNESFATYGEYLWFEHKYGREMADVHGLKDQLAYFNAKKELLDVIRFDYSDREQMFDVVTYQKGGRILHMLRKTVGDEAFFKALNLYLKRHSYKNTEIHDLRLAFEEVTGQDLNWFFNQWFLSSGHPVLVFQTNYDQESKKAMVTIKQLQDLSKTPLYQIPLAIDIYKGGKSERQNVILNQQTQLFTFSADVAPDLINVDAEKYILGEKTETKSLQQLVFQYDNAPLFLDRFEALTALSALRKEKIARDTYIKALKDKNWVIRQMAVEFVPQLEEVEKATVYPIIKNIALTDERSYVRAAAVIILGKAYSTSKNSSVFEKTIKDKSPTVVQATQESR